MRVRGSERGRRVAPPAIAAILLIGIVACGGTPDRDDGRATATAAAAGGDAGPVPPSTAWATVLAGIGPEGTVDADTARQAFALAFGDVPGVEVPDGPPGEVTSGSEALRWAVRVRDQLTDAQKAEVDRVLAATNDAGGGGGRSFTRRNGADTSRYRTIVDEVLARYQGPLGPLPIPTSISLVPANGTAWAYADGFDAQAEQHGSAVRCAIGITPKGEKGSDDELDQVLAHELFHCYQFAWMGLDRVYHDEQSAPWVIEGAATWAAINSMPAETEPEVNWWITYLVTPATPLFSRSYDAIGFYGQVHQQGVELWPLLRTFHTTQGNLARYHVLADPAGPGFLDVWAPGYFRRPARGAAWDITGKSVPEAGTLDPPVQSLDIADGGEATASAEPFTSGLEVIDTSADLTHLAFTGHARLADEGGFDSTELADLYLCTRPGGDCSCPDQAGGDGADGLPASRQAVQGTLILGLTGGTDGTTGSVSGQSLDDFCSKRKAPAAAETSTLPPCQVVTPEDAARLVPELAGATAGEQLLNANGSGICAYAVPDGTSAAAVDAQVYHRPQSAPVEQDWPTLAAMCTEDLPGVGDRAGIGGGGGGLFGCVLANHTIVTMAVIGGGREALVDVLGTIAGRL